MTIWVVLACVVALYAISVMRLKPKVFFGLLEDDSIYFSSAKALAEGHGYVLPSVPGLPTATKYPILYPWLLSWVWRLDASFPANINDAAAVNIAFGFAFIIGAFVFFKEIGRLGDGEALFLTAFCGLHPIVIIHSANLLTEIPFAALTLWAAVMASKAVSADGTARASMISGMLSGAAFLTRLVGLPFAAGLYLAILWRKGWRKSLIFAGGALPFLGVLVWTAVVKPASQAPPLSVSGCARVWQMNWLYYTSYLSFWKADAIQGHALWNMVKQNLTLLSVQPGIYFLNPQVLKPSGPAIIAALLLSVGVWKGLIAHAKGKLEPIHFALALYLIPVILWDYPLVERFLIPFLPFIVLGLWLEVARLFGLIKRSMANSAPRGQKPAAVFLAFALVGLMLFTGRSFQLGLKELVENSKIRGRMLGEKEQAYAWLRQHTGSGEIVIAYEDASLFLYTGRQSFRPVILSPAGAFHAEQRQKELDCITASAIALRARYWLISDDDYGMEPGRVEQFVRANKSGGSFQEVFLSEHHKVSVLEAETADRR
jgi:hypothetical protein